jgi:hypothetical protein
MAVSFDVESCDGLMNCDIEDFGIREGPVSEMMDFEIASDALEFWGIFRKPRDQRSL